MPTGKPKWEHMVIPWENNYLVSIISYNGDDNLIIYKIKNSINNKIYIGLTTCSLAYRWSKHLIEGKNVNNKKHLYKAGNAILTEEEVLKIRKYYVNHTLQETFDKYGSKYSKEGFRGVLTRTYSHIPIYQKTKKQWILNNEIIDINNYKPVSTISESGE